MFNVVLILSLATGWSFDRNSLSCAYTDNAKKEVKLVPDSTKLNRYQIASKMEIPIKLTAFLSLPLVCLEGVGLRRSVFKENIGEERLNSSKWLEEAEDQSSGEHTHNRVTSDITQTAPALFYSFVVPPLPSSSVWPDIQCLLLFC